MPRCKWDQTKNDPMTETLKTSESDCQAGISRQSSTVHPDFSNRQATNKHPTRCEKQTRGHVSRRNQDIPSQKTTILPFRPNTKPHPFHQASTMQADATRPTNRCKTTYAMIRGQTFFVKKSNTEKQNADRTLVTRTAQ